MKSFAKKSLTPATDLKQKRDYKRSQGGVVKKNRAKGGDYIRQQVSVSTTASTGRRMVRLGKDDGIG